MAEEDKDKSQQTEDPTPKRIEDAYKKGQIIYSKDLTNFLFLCILTLLVIKLLPYLLQSSLKNLNSFITSPDQIDLATPRYLGRIYLRLLKEFSLIVLPFVGLLFVVALISPSLQNTRLIFSLESLRVDLSRISIFNGFGRIFSKNSVIEFVKGIVKITLIGFISYWVIKNLSKKILNIHDVDIWGIILIFKDNIGSLLFKILIFLFLVAIFDYFYQRMQFFQNLRMSKQDIKEEFKDTEGSPEVKAKIKRLRAEKSKKRMLAQVPQADVVITNPTHFAVALKYDLKKMAAPVVIAKGVDKVALRIREIARDNKVPIIENPLLARELYKLVDLDEEIPLDYYQTVAEIISYVYKLKGKEI